MSFFQLNTNQSIRPVRYTFLTMALALNAILTYAQGTTPIIDTHARQSAWDSTGTAYELHIALQKAALNIPKKILLKLSAADTDQVVRTILIGPEQIAGTNSNGHIDVLSVNRTHFLFTIDNLMSGQYKVRFDVLEAGNKVRFFEATEVIPAN